MQALTNPKIMVYAQVLTASDKQMLGNLQGTGNWASNGPANLLVDEITASRQNGTLTGNVSTSFIQDIIKKQGNASLTEPDAGVPASVLSAALQWIQTNASGSNSASKLLGSAPAAQAWNSAGRTFMGKHSASFLMRAYNLQTQPNKTWHDNEIGSWQLTNQPRRINPSLKYRHINLNAVDVRAQVIDLAFEVNQFTLKSSQPLIVHDHRPND